MTKTKISLLTRLLMLSFALAMFTFTSCDEDKDEDPIEVIVEAEVLVDYLESTGGTVVNTFAVMKKASDVYTEIGDNQYVIDIRAEDAYNAGHIEGAINVAAGDVLTHYETNNLQDKDVVVLVCYSGQSAAWVNGLMHTVGYTNCKDMKWGMCSWSDSTSGSWTSETNVGNHFVDQMVTEATEKGAAGDLPTLSTGETVADKILRARVEAIFAEGFSEAAVGSSSVFAATDSYYIVNYWSTEHYEWNHIPTAVQYTPKESLTSDTFLKTLPTDQTIAVYCYTGQTSAHVAAYLRVLGYDAKTVKFGVNGMAHSTMPATAFNADTEIHDYPLFP